MPKRTTSKAAAPQMKPAAIRQFHVKLHAWYQIHGRHDLPWRNTADPYRIWVSEVMLQQTQVATVCDRFYGQFLDKFQDVEALAAAPREAVMKAWEGLGYYRRAGFLHEAAKRAGNRLPDDLQGLLALPGIGRNTAHAILAFAHHRAVPILEANVKRIVARIFAFETPREEQLWHAAELLLNRAEPFHYNQSMMDLGSLICLPKNPKCSICPAKNICLGQKNPESYPAPKVKKQVPVREVMIVVREDARGRLFLEKREEKLLGGLYGFTQKSCESVVVSRAERKADDSRLMTRDSLGTVTHIYSHFKLIGHVVMEKSSIHSNSPDWYSRAEIVALPLSTLDHKVLALVDKCNTGEKKRTKKMAGRAAR